MHEQASVAALYRYPVKAFTPEEPAALQVLSPGNRIEGDRVLAFLLGDAGEPHAQANGGDWWPKSEMLTLMSTPGLARLRLRYDISQRWLVINDQQGQPLVAAGLDDAGRTAIAGAVEQYVRALDPAVDLDRPGRTPLRLIGDGVTPRFQDSSSGRITLHSRGSLRSLAAALGDEALSEKRFRSNIAVEGLEAWEELSWEGRQVRIGEVVFDVVAPAVRCLATHVDVEQGVRDREILRTLPEVNGREKPSFAISLLPRTPGTIRLQDPVSLE